jgi:hypothetical protein
MKPLAKAHFPVLGCFSVLLTLSGCGGPELECDSPQARNSVLRIIADDHNNALVNYAAKSSDTVAAKMTRANGQADKSAILEMAKRGAVYKLGDTIVMRSRDRAAHAVTCGGILDVTVEDATAEKEVGFTVKQTTDGGIVVSVEPFRFAAQ